MKCIIKGLLILSIFLSQSDLHAEEGGVIGGGPNASVKPDSSLDLSPGTAYIPGVGLGTVDVNGSVTVPYIVTPSVLKPVRRPTIKVDQFDLPDIEIELSQQRFREIAMKTVEEGPKPLYISPAVRAFKPQIVDLPKKTITGLSEDERIVRLIQEQKAPTAIGK